MPHGTGLILTITASLVGAFAGGFIATRLRLPPIVGYLLAGIAIGPFTPGFTGNVQIATELAEIQERLAIQIDQVREKVRLIERTDDSEPLRISA